MPLTTYNNVSIPSFMYGTAWKEDDTAPLVRQALDAAWEGATQLAVRAADAAWAANLLGVIAYRRGEEEIAARRDFEDEVVRLIACYVMAVRSASPGATSLPAAPMAIPTSACRMYHPNSL